MKCEKCGIDIGENETLCENCKGEKSVELNVATDVQIDEVGKNKKVKKEKKSPNSILGNSIFAVSSPIISLILFSILVSVTLFIQTILDLIFSPVNVIPVIGQIVYIVIVIFILSLLLVPFLVTAVFSVWAFFYSIGTIISSSHYKRHHDDSKLKMNISKILAIIGLFSNAIIVFIALLPIVFSIIALCFIILVAIIAAILFVIIAIIGVIVFIICILLLFIYGDDFFAVLSSMLIGLGEMAESLTPMIGSLGQIAELISLILNILLIFI